jgi:hypothetical protein
MRKGSAQALDGMLLRAPAGCGALVKTTLLIMEIIGNLRIFAAAGN